jgi:hypothetical protein
MKSKAAATNAMLAGKVRAKNEFRRKQAAMPFARKVEIVVRLQQIAAGIGKAAGKKPVRSAWRIPARRRPA